MATDLPIPQDGVVALVDIGATMTTLTSCAGAAACTAANRSSAASSSPTR